MGIVYHANYFTWFEIARIDLLDKLGCSYLLLEEEGFRLPVLEINACYKVPAGLDDILDVEATINELPRVKIRIEYRVLRDDTVLTTGFSLHAFMDRDGFPIKPPDRFMNIIRPLFGK